MPMNLVTKGNTSGCEMSLILNNPFISEVSQYLPYYKQIEINRKSIKGKTDKSYVDLLKGAEKYMISMHGKVVKN